MRTNMQRQGWMWSLFICLTDSLPKWEWMEGFPMSWLEDGWVCDHGFNWLKTGIQLGIIESWKSLKAQVHEIISRANQVVINPWSKSSLVYRLKGACYPAIFKLPQQLMYRTKLLCSCEGTFKCLETAFLKWLGSYLFINDCSVLTLAFTCG